MSANRVIQQRPVSLAIPAGDFDPDATCPGDTAALMRLREAIDDHGWWENQAQQEAGDYEGCVRFMERELERLSKLAGVAR